MAGIDLTTAQAKLQTWLDAEEKVALGQSVTFDGRTITRAHLAEIAKRIDYWSHKVQAASGGRIGMMRMTYRD